MQTVELKILITGMSLVVQGVKTSSFNALAVRSVPGQGAKTPHMTRPKTKTQNRNNILTIQ